MDTRAFGIRTAALVAHGIGGAVVFFIVFAAMFNGLTAVAVAAAAGGLGVNFLVSMRLARRAVLAGVLAALAFAGALLLFAVFSLGDLLAQGDAQPFLFWSLAAITVIAAGMLGVYVGGRSNRPAQSADR